MNQTILVLERSGTSRTECAVLFKDQGSEVIEATSEPIEKGAWHKPGPFLGEAHMVESLAGPGAIEQIVGFPGDRRRCVFSPPNATEGSASDFSIRGPTRNLSRPISVRRHLETVTTAFLAVKIITDRNLPRIRLGLICSLAFGIWLPFSTVSRRLIQSVGISHCSTDVHYRRFSSH